MTVALNVYDAFNTYSRVEDMKRNEWLASNPRAAEIITAVWELREQHGD